MSMGQEHLDDTAYERYNSPSEQSVKKKSVFTRGYKECREKLSKNSTFSRSCFNCEHYYQASGDKEEVCQNESVLSYDMVVTDNQIYCVKWQPLSSKDDSMFTKKGRSRLD